MPSLPSDPREEDYETIASAVMETARGRWFLNEFARRNRAADTQKVLEAVEKLEKTIACITPASETHSSLHVQDMKTAIEDLYKDLEQLQLKADPSDHPGRAIAGSAEETTHRIIAAAEGVQETAWALRELGAHSDFCEKLERKVKDIYLACSFQDLTAQRYSRVMQTINFLENRIRAFGGIAGASSTDEKLKDDPRESLPSEPVFHSENLEQNATDDVSNSRHIGADLVILDDAQVVSPASYLGSRSSTHTINLNRPTASTLIEAQKLQSQRSSLSAMQKVLTDEFSADEEQKRLNSAKEEDGPAAFQLSDYCFEEKLALFS
jgi:chemotaxis regulatin CheY-phosphate phosphatase CheZ